MAMSEYEKSKFRFSETFNNKDGKTSGSGFVGVLFGMTTALCFVAGAIGLFFKIEGVMDLVDASLQLGLLSGALLGLRKATSMFGQGRVSYPRPAAEAPKEPEEEPEK